MSYGWYAITLRELIDVLIFSIIFSIAVTSLLRAVCLIIYYIVEIIRDWFFWRF